MFYLFLITNLCYCHIRSSCWSKDTPYYSYRPL